MSSPAAALQLLVGLLLGLLGCPRQQLLCSCWLRDPYLRGPSSREQNLAQDFVLWIFVKWNPLREQAHDGVPFYENCAPDRVRRFCFTCDSVGIRTQDPQLRRLLLYPAELPNQSIPFELLLIGDAKVGKISDNAIKNQILQKFE